MRFKFAHNCVAGVQHVVESSTYDESDYIKTLCEELFEHKDFFVTDEKVPYRYPCPDCMFALILEQAEA